MKSGKGKPPSLKGIYYRTFVSLVAIPLLMVFIGTMFVINHQIRKASLEHISTFQEGLADTLKQEIDENSLQMAHFVYSQDGYFLQLAESVASTEGTVQYKYNNELAEGFQMAMVPSQNIVGGTFYMKNGAQVHMKETVLLSTASVRGTRWYQQAMERKNVVAVGAYDTGNMRFTANTQKNRQLILVSALSPDATLDKGGQVEMSAFFTVSKAGTSMRRKGRSNALGTTVLLDEEGTLLFSGNETVSEYFRQHGPEFVEGMVEYRAAPDGKHPAKYLFQTRVIPCCGWKLVTVVQSSFLTQGLDRIGVLLGLVISGLLGLFFLFSRYFLNSIVNPVHAVAEGMEKLVNNDLNVQVQPMGQPEIQNLMVSFNQMVLSLKNMLEVNAEAQRRKHRAEIQALQSQINPHFIVNTLNSIRFMAQVAGYAGIQKMAESLMKIVSCSFRSNISFYTLREELDVLDSYVYLMRIRYADSFEVSYDIAEDCLDYMLPRLLLQPVVENSITHGFAEMEEELGQIDVTARRKGEMLCLIVRDNGCGMSQEQIEQVLHGHAQTVDDNTSIGLKNVLARIRLNFGGKAQMEITSEPQKYTQTVIRLPWKEEKADDTDADRR